MNKYRKLIRGFSKIKGYDGWMIATAGLSGKKYGILADIDCNTEEIDDNVKTQILKQKPVMSVMQSSFDETFINMNIVKMHENVDKYEIQNRFCGYKNYDNTDEYEEVCQMTFTVEEILNFVTEVKDDNYIHKTDVPVVPGFYILEKMLSATDSFKDSERVVIKFRKPAYAGDIITVAGIKTDVTGREKYIGYVTEKGKDYILWKMSIY